MPDPDVEIKGFSLFGSTDVLTYISTAPGNTVFNGAVQVSSDVYITGKSTFTAPLQIWNPPGFSGNLFYISTGTANVIRMTGAGEVYANKFYGDGSGLGNITATDNTKVAKAGDFMGGQLTTESTITIKGNAFSVGGSTLVVSAGNVGIGTTNPSEKLEVAENGKKSFEVRPDTNYVSLLIDGIEVARIRP